MTPALALYQIFVIVLTLQEISETPRSGGSAGPYCGVYCVAAAARMCGRDINIAELTDQRFVGSRQGSSISELRDAISHSGLIATPLTGMTVSGLRNCPYPVILHVRRPGYGMPFAHWVLFAGVEGDQARVFDPSAGTELTPFAELSAVWDGVGIVVSDGAPETNELRFFTWFESLLLMGAVGLALGLIRLSGPGNRMGGFACVVIPVAGAAVLLVSHYLSGAGLYADRSAVSLVVGHHFRPEIPEIDLETARQLAGDPDTVLVDTRLRGDYESGHLPGAISLPVISGMSERREFSRVTPKNRRIVAYCQSNGCVWSDSVAADLYHRGHTNICVFRGGWREWSHGRE